MNVFRFDTDELEWLQVAVEDTRAVATEAGDRVLDKLHEGGEQGVATVTVQVDQSSVDRAITLINRAQHEIEAGAVAFLLDGLGVDSLAELRALVELGREDPRRQPVCICPESYPGLGQDCPVHPV